MATRNINDLIATQKVANASYTLENGQIILATGTITTSKPAVSATQTWNDAGVAFTGIKLNVTDTASAAASLLLDLQVGGASQLNLTKSGILALTATGSASVPAVKVGNENTGIYRAAASQLGFAAGSSGVARLTGGGFHLASGTSGFFGWYSDSTYGTLQGAMHLDAANTLAIRNAANAQALHLYGTFTDASNYRRLLFGSTTAGVFSITPVGAGTGAAGNVLHISGLPTSNPGAGILWNNAGTPAIGT